MSHSMTAFVARRPALIALAQGLGGAPFYKLKHAEFFVLPVSDDVFDRVVELKGPGNLVAVEFWGLTNHLAQLAREASAHGLIAYIETDYFGGMGTQGTAVWKDETAFQEPATASKGTINLALRAIGLGAGFGLDEFDTLGLGDVRHMSDFEAMAPQP